MSSDSSVTTSIIIPCFNRAQFIQESIESSIEQDSEVEVIVVDDGSTDGSWDIISSYDEIVAIRIENSGPSAARNKGLAIARGKYAKFHDSDDRFPHASLKKLVQFANGLGKKKIAFGDAALIDEHGHPTTGPTYGYSDLPEGPVNRSQIFSKVMSTVLPLFPTEVLRSIGGFNSDLRLGEDHELALRLCALGFQFEHLPVVVCEVREHRGDRLSRNYGAAGYRAQYSTFETAWDALAVAESPLSRHERAKLGGMIWALGRAASRERHRAEADALFALAKQIGSREAYVGPTMLKLAYRLIFPYAAERLLEDGKALSRFFRSPR